MSIQISRPDPISTGIYRAAAEVGRLANRAAELERRGAPPSAFAVLARDAESVRRKLLHLDAKVAHESERLCDYCTTWVAEADGICRLDFASPARIGTVGDVRRRDHVIVCADCRDEADLQLSEAGVQLRDVHWFGHGYAD